jgi:hypothetical protein
VYIHAICRHFSSICYVCYPALMNIPVFILSLVLYFPVYLSFPLYPVSPCLSVILCPVLYLPVYLSSFLSISSSPCLSFLFFSSVSLSLSRCIFPLFLLPHSTYLYLSFSDALLPCLSVFLLSICVSPCLSVPISLYLFLSMPIFLFLALCLSLFIPLHLSPLPAPSLSLRLSIFLSLMLFFPV